MAEVPIIEPPTTPSRSPFSYKVEVNQAMNNLVTSLDTLPSETTLADTPLNLAVPLFDHQRYGLQWLTWREANVPAGGILADDMGLGKTIMMLALILQSKTNRTQTPDTQSNYSESTLIVVPPSLLQQWEDEVIDKAPHLTYYIYHGSDRATTKRDLLRHDIVLSTYQTLASYDQKPNAKTGEGANPIKDIDWLRIILDEGHNIRNHKTRWANAMCNLNSKYRWIMTGTPIHNKPSDMYSLVKFLRFEPFNKSLVWNFWIGLKKINGDANSARFATFGKALLLCRTKENIMKNSLSKHNTDITVQLSPEERLVYNHVLTLAEGLVKKFLQNQELLKNLRLNKDAGQMPTMPNVTISHVFVLLLRLRQLSVLPYLITRKDNVDESDKENAATENKTPPNELAEAIAKEVESNNEVFDKMFKSAKIKQLLMDLNKLREEARRKNLQMEKAIIVSQWTSLLDVVALHLDEEGYTFETISGDIHLDDRSDIQEDFNSEDDGPDILLLSLCAGGVGLNLTGASRMYILDVHYNPQLEAQAISRIHRYGQKREVYITRYICEDSMEQRVLKLQEDKLKLVKRLLNGTTSDGIKLDVATLKELFRFK